MSVEPVDALEGSVNWVAGLVQIGAELTPAILDDISDPLYLTDADGVVTHYNQACVGFAGRTPELGLDRWCVTWKLYTEDGEALPHAECPMALAINTGQRVRGLSAVAERPDGSRVRFRPYPTPIADAQGRVVAAVNLLVEA